MPSRTVASTVERHGELAPTAGQRVKPSSLTHSGTLLKIKPGSRFSRRRSPGSALSDRVSIGRPTRCSSPLAGTTPESVRSKRGESSMSAARNPARAGRRHRDTRRHRRTTTGPPVRPAYGNKCVRRPSRTASSTMDVERACLASEPDTGWIEMVSLKDEHIEAPIATGATPAAMALTHPDEDLLAVTRITPGLVSVRRPRRSQRRNSPSPYPTRWIPKHRLLSAWRTAKDASS